MMGILAVTVVFEFAVVMLLLITLGNAHMRLRRMEMELYRMSLFYGDRQLTRPRRERL